MSFFLIAMTFLASIIAAYFMALLVAMVFVTRGPFVYLAIPTAVIGFIALCYGGLLFFVFSGLIGGGEPFQNFATHLFGSWVITSWLSFIGVPAAIFIGISSIKTAREEV